MHLVSISTDRKRLMKQEADLTSKRLERRLFLFLTVVLFPVIAVGLVAAYGFVVWMWQLANGPPGV
jgi:nitrate reductase NapE